MIMANNNKRINFNSNIPYYIQLVEIFKEKIKNRDWIPLIQIPSEPDLCEMYGVSRTVVRQALREIELEGLVIRRKGKGTFVSEPKINESLIQKLTGFYNDMVERGIKPVTKVLRFDLEQANPKIADYLKIDIGTSVFCIERLRYVDLTPIVLVTSYIPMNLCPNLQNFDLTNQSLYNILENEFGIMLSHGKRSIEAVGANDREANLLEVEESAPLILLDSVTYQDDGTPVEYYHAVHRGDRTRFEVELVRVKEKRKLIGKINEILEELPPSN
jgi:GntR family transcriptional regulator